MKKGDLVKVTGKGKTARWPAMVGRVSKATISGARVHWLGCMVEDAMTEGEVELVTEAERAAIVPAIGGEWVSAEVATALRSVGFDQQAALIDRKVKAGAPDIGKVKR